MSGLEGAITLRLGLAGDAVERVEVHSTRRLDACSVLEERSVAEVLRLVPTLYGICGTAQAHAALAAAEAALGLEPNPAQYAARRLLLQAETAGEHAWRVLMDWPALIGEEAAVTELSEVRKPLGTLAGRLYPDHDWSRLGGGRLAPDHRALGVARVDLGNGLRRVVFGKSWTAPRTVDAFEAWAQTGETPPARLVRHLLDEGLAGAGASDLEPLPGLDAEELEARLGGADAADMVARPDWRGSLYHTGPLARRWKRPLVASVRERYGAGLLAWVAARLDELSGADKAMAALIPAVAVDAGGTGGEGGSGIGLGVVEAARGRLVHRLEVTDGVITAYRVLAPTEWNFHPEGALAHGLIGAPAERAERLAALLVAAVDPCVACRVEVA